MLGAKVPKKLFMENRMMAQIFWKKYGGWDSLNKIVSWLNKISKDVSESTWSPCDFFDN